MQYQITYFMAKGTHDRFSFLGSFDEVRTEAREAVESGECWRVEVRDSQGLLRYHYPRAQRPVPAEGGALPPLVRL